MKLGIRIIMVISFALLLHGCSNSTKAELAEYLNQELADYDEFIKEGSDIEATYIKAMEAGQTDEVFAILTEEFIPIVESTLKRVEAYESESDEIIDLNDELVKRTSAFNERLHTLVTAYRQFEEMETDEELLEAINTMDNAIDHMQQYVDYDTEVRTTIDDLIEKYDIDVDGKVLSDQDVADKEDVATKILNEASWFVTGLGYDPGIVYAENLNEAILKNNQDDSASNDPEEIASSDEFQVELVGEVLVDDGLVIHGESNLPEGAELEAVVYLHGTKVSDGHTAYTNETGSFEIDIEDLGIKDGEIEVQVHFRPADQDLVLQELYGEKGEQMEGDYVYIYSSIRRTFFQAMMTANFVMSETGKVSFEIPEWNPSDDYGELDIWMEVDEFIDHGVYYDIHVRSNLMEGTKVRGDIEIPDYDSAGFRETTFVLPDGSFKIRIQAPDLDNDKVNVKMEVLPSNLILTDTEELYGANGEYFEGDLVEKHKNGQKIKYLFSAKDVN